MCQAYLLLSVWTLGPEKTFEQDRTWMMLGEFCAIASTLDADDQEWPYGE